MKRFIALFLVFSLLAISGNLYAKRKGAELVIQKKDKEIEVDRVNVKRIIRDEKEKILEITTKDGKTFRWAYHFISAREEDDKIIITTYGKQVRGELIAVKEHSLLLLDSEGADISVDIEDIKVITIVKGSKAGLGAGLGLLIGGGIGAFMGSFAEWSKAGAIVLGAIGGLSGLLAGVIIGAASEGGKTIQIEGKSDSEINEVLEELRKKARIPKYQ